MSIHIPIRMSQKARITLAGLLVPGQMFFMGADAWRAKILDLDFSKPGSFELALSMLERRHRQLARRKRSWSAEDQLGCILVAFKRLKAYPTYANLLRVVDHCLIYQQKDLSEKFNQTLRRSIELAKGGVRT